MFLDQAITARQERLIKQMNNICNKKFNLTTITPRYKKEATAYITENYPEFTQRIAVMRHAANGGVII